MADPTLSTQDDSAFLEALKRCGRAPETPEGVAWEMTRIILLCTQKPPSRADILDLYAECLRTAEGERHAHNFTAH